MANDSDHDTGPKDARALARDCVQARRDLRTHAVVYLVVNSFLVLVWAVTGSGYFWPAWSIGGWGIGLVLHAWSVVGDRPVTEEDVDDELARTRTGNHPE